MLRTVLGAPWQRRIARWFLGPPALAVRWLATRDRVELTQVRLTAPPLVAPTLDRFAGVLLPSEGAGPGIHRTYSVRIAGAADQAQDAIDRLARDPNLLCSIEVGHFEADDGGHDVTFSPLRELRVELTGPYRGPVRVVERTAQVVRLQTRDGHIEAGQIQFATTVHGDDLEFTIASWTRSRDRHVDILYRSGPARWAQQHMWTSMCRQLAHSAGSEDPVVEVCTVWLPPDVALLGERTP